MDNGIKLNANQAKFVQRALSTNITEWHTGKHSVLQLEDRLNHVVVTADYDPESTTGLTFSIYALEDGSDAE